MPGIWSKRSDGEEWRLLSPAGFPDEARLHDLVASAPQLLPLAGSPQLTVVGREVQLGTGYADIVAVESTGRIAIIEVKLARNAEARRAIVSQVLAYAAFLHGVSVEELETRILTKHLASREYLSLLDAARAADQQNSVDEAVFSRSLSQFLAEGRFRLVLVLDDAPQELVRLVGYLAAITDNILIDPITVSSFDVNGTQVLMPQRVDAEPSLSAPRAIPSPPVAAGRLTDGAADFEATIAETTDPDRSDLQRYTRWAKQLEAEGLVRLQTYAGVAQRVTLLPRLRAEGVGMVTIWNDRGSAYLQLWRSVVERHAPHLVAEIEAILAPSELRQGNSVRGASDELLAALTAAYRAATSASA